MCARGDPGVSVAGNGDGTQLGEAADRANNDAEVVALVPGATVAAPLTSVELGASGGALGCPTETADGRRVYPPHSYMAVFVKDPSTIACTDEQVFLHLLGPVAAQ
ncbi:MAG: DUF4232 domain-containing protein [Microbacterium sp.]